MSKDIIYQMLPRLWGEGSMASVDDATLSYLKGLGITHLWCTGIIRHSTGQPFVKGDAGSPYAISNYYDVNPYLATVPSRRISEFRSLVSRVHKHGLKFIIDFVPNHVGCDYSDKHGDIPLCGWHDYDWSDTIKIDYNAPGTWEAMYRIVRFWASKGVDGFRCDMVELVPPEFLKWLIAKIKEEFPEVVFIAEVYQKEKYRMYIEDVRFDYLYDKSGLYDVLRALTAGHGTARAITWNWQFLQDLQPRMLNFLENHDEQRLASPWFAGRGDFYALLCTSLMLNTAPFMLYFGQETGVDASEGHEGRTSIFNFAKPESLRRLYDWIHGEKGLSAEEQDILRHYEDALALASEPCVSEGETFDLCYCQAVSDGFDADRHFAFLRHVDGYTRLFVCNFTDLEARMTIRIPQHAVDYLQLGSNPAPAGISLTIKPFDYTSIVL
jgi:glycosidase